VGNSRSGVAAKTRNHSGVQGLSHTRFGGQVEQSPRAESATPRGGLAPSADPDAHCRTSAEKCKFFRAGSREAAANASRRALGKEWSRVQTSKALKALSLGLALLLATTALAASKGSLQLTTPAIVAGKQLPAGEYKVTWEGSGPAVEANIMQGKTLVAKVQAKIVELDRTPSMDAAVVRKSEDGSSTLNQIRFSGKKYALEVSDQSAARSADTGK